MKKTFICLVIIGFSLLKLNGQEISDDPNSPLDRFIKSKISIKKEKVVSDTLQKVFNGTFYKVDAGFAFGDGGAFTGILFVIKDNKMIQCVSRTDSLSTLQSLIRKDFFLKTESDARFFETSLDKLFPISWTSAEYKQHLKIKNQWYFIRDKFFDSKSGYIITLDNNSKISNINYSMEAIKKE